MRRAITYTGSCTFCGGTQRFLEAPQKASVSGRTTLGWIKRCDGCHGPSIFLASDPIPGSDTSTTTPA